MALQIQHVKLYYVCKWICSITLVVFIMELLYYKYMTPICVAISNQYYYHYWHYIL